MMGIFLSQAGSNRNTVFDEKGGELTKILQFDVYYRTDLETVADDAE